ncbi:MAG: hypothetical protein ABH868_03215 [bacterium]
MKKLSFAVLSLLILLSVSLVNADNDFTPEFQKGISYIVWDKDYYGSRSSDDTLEKLAKTNAEWVGLHTTWYQQKYDAMDIHPTSATPSDDGLIHAIKTIHELGMKVMLKPQLDLLDSSGGEWRGSIEFDTEEDWQTWFDSYTAFMTHYGRLAQENGVEMICIGTELTAATTVRSDLWKDKVIKSVREVYQGPLTYAANWYDEYLDIQFWDALDYVGIDPYFPLVSVNEPSFKEIKQGWESRVKEIEEWQKTINKPIIFTEIGYRSSTGSAKNPWEHMPGKKIDLEQQADCYKALFETFWDKSWFYGIYWWEWGSSVKSGGPKNRGFSPQNKPAEDVIKKWYEKIPEGKR